MATWADIMASDQRDLVVYGTVAGVGSSPGLWRFSTRAGWSLADGEGLWAPWLIETPDLLATVVPYIEGGVTEKAGSMELRIGDPGRVLTDLLRVDAPPVAGLRIQMTDIQGTVPVTDGHGFVIGDVLWCGAEAMKVTALNTSTSISVTRGYLGTNVVAHAAGTPIYRHPNLLRSREARLYVAPTEGSDTEAQLVGVFTVSDVEYSEKHTAWHVIADLREPYLDRRTPRQPFRVKVREWTTNSSGRVIGVDASDLLLADAWLVGGTDPRTIAIAPADGDSSSEVIRISAYPRPGVQSVLKRAESGGKVEDDPGTGDWVRVMSARNGDFRIGDGASSEGSRSPVHWTPTDHVIDIVLSILCSPAIDAEGDPPQGNRFTTEDGANYSGLPVGSGLGVPVADIDYTSFLDVKERLGEYARLPNFVLGPEPMTFRDLSEHLLKPFGLIMWTDGRGKIRVALPRIEPADFAPAVTITPDDVLTTPDQRGNHRPRVQAKRDVESTAMAVNLTLGRQEVEQPITWGEFARTFDPLDVYETDGESLDFEVPGADPEDFEALKAAAKRRLWRTFRPPTLIEMDLDARLWSWGIAEQASFTMPGLINPSTGAMGFVNAACQLVEREERSDRERGLHLHVKAHLVPQARIGRIAPAADVVSVSGAGPYVVTVEANRYTATDARNDLPTNDAEAFSVGDVVQLVNSAGVDVGSGGTATVTAVTSSQLTLDSNFGGALLADRTIIYADADDAVAQQRERYVFMASLETRRIGTTGDIPWSFGEP